LCSEFLPFRRFRRPPTRLFPAPTARTLAAHARRGRTMVPKGGTARRPAIRHATTGSAHTRTTRFVVVFTPAAPLARPHTPNPMLSDKDIKAALAARTIIVEPIEDPDVQIQPA